MVLLLPIINRCIEILSARHGFLNKLFFVLKLLSAITQDAAKTSCLSTSSAFLRFGGQSFKRNTFFTRTRYS